MAEACLEQWKARTAAVSLARKATSQEERSLALRRAALNGWSSTCTARVATQNEHRGQNSCLVHPSATDKNHPRLVCPVSSPRTRAPTRTDASVSRHSIRSNESMASNVSLDADVDQKIWEHTEGKKDQEEMTKLAKRMEKLSNQVVYLESKNKILENENRALTAQATADRQLASYASSYSSAALQSLEEKKALERKLQQEALEADALRDLLRMKDDTISDLKREADEHAERISQLQGTIEYLQRRMQENENEKMSLKKETERLSQELETKTTYKDVAVQANPDVMEKLIESDSEISHVSLDENHLEEDFKSADLLFDESGKHSSPCYHEFKSLAVDEST
ncbi:hypothetical protein GUITHDRAFT_118042 [Guillardia theta CCMP2712]|uniref:Uncharacterized protein n=1 Tax=Guillardia theta (strain CCMP2712) TaxID=905079 RepID=L1II67_GUITC|nr:hypothetical protein GUITHDRAFT_118042 [Guillardia theta CCMP2712]EKX35767.1 hypothetical protein GUITHDRAFT_118042 [Guillardia theta CCMP2712]|eukprot:XP_005822747.1 hypothetical protein GUITHDRAFT_118042 [Guillardia theta CCMP2712]